MHVRPAASSRALKRSAASGERVWTTTGRSYTSSASDARHADTTGGAHRAPHPPLRTSASASSSCSQRWIRAPLAPLLGLKHGPGRISHDHPLPDRLPEERQRAKHERVGKSPGQLAPAPRREHDRAHGARREGVLEEPVRHPAHRNGQGDLRIGGPDPGTHQVDPGRGVPGDRAELTEPRDPVGESRRFDGREHDAIMGRSNLDGATVAMCGRITQDLTHTMLFDRYRLSRSGASTCAQRQAPATTGAPRRISSWSGARARSARSRSSAGASSPRGRRTSSSGRR